MTFSLSTPRLGAPLTGIAAGPLSTARDFRRRTPAGGTANDGASSAWVLKQRERRGLVPAAQFFLSIGLKALDFGRRERGLPEENMESSRCGAPPRNGRLALALVAFLLGLQQSSGGMEDHRMSTPVQLVINRPVVCMSTACAALALTSAKVSALIEEGGISWAWNLALHRQCRREIRILTQSIAECQRGERHLTGGDEELPAVLRLIFPMLGQGPGAITTLSGMIIADRLGIDQGHAGNLINARLFKMAKGAVCRRGRGGSPQIVLESVLELLRARRIL